MTTSNVKEGNGEAATDVTNDVTRDPNVSSTLSGRLGIRHLQVLLLFFGMTIGYCLRVNMSVVIVEMANSSLNSSFESYGWNTEQRSTILSSFFWGYTVTQIPSGYIVGIWSAQKLVSIGMSLCGIFQLITPVAAHYGGLIAVCACRVGMGLTQGCLLPCVHSLLSKWAPPTERARLGTFAYAGAQLGTVIAFPISGVVAASKSLGWPSVFYIFGAFAVLWGVVYFLWGADTPSEHSRISDDERRYIEESILGDQANQQSEKKQKVPWKEIFTSLPMWAIIIAHCGQNWGYWTLLTEMPSYMKAILHYKIDENGFISALPYLAMWILSFPASWLSDYALRKNVSRATIRKVSNTIAHWGPAIALVAMGFVPNDVTTPAVAILVIAVGLNAGSLCGFQINHIDLSPNFAGTMMSITNCIASVVAIAAPLICGEIVKVETDVSQWHTVFYVAAVIYFVCNLFFIIYAKGDVQWWNDPAALKVDKEKRKRSMIT